MKLNRYGTLLVAAGLAVAGPAALATSADYNQSQYNTQYDNSAAGAQSNDQLDNNQPNTDQANNAQDNTGQINDNQAADNYQPDDNNNQAVDNNNQADTDMSVNDQADYSYDETYDDTTNAQIDNGQTGVQANVNNIDNAQFDNQAKNGGSELNTENTQLSNQADTTNNGANTGQYTAGQDNNQNGSDQATYSQSTTIQTEGAYNQPNGTQNSSIGNDTQFGTTQNTTGWQPGPTMTFSGQVAGFNPQARTFWVNTNNQDVAVNIGNADIRFGSTYANMYRLMGSPQVQVSGTMTPAGLLDASTINIQSGPNVRLQESAYTDMASPSYSSGELVPFTGTAGISTASTSYAGHPSYASKQSMGSSHRMMMGQASSSQGATVRHHRHHRHHRRHHSTR